MKVKPGMLVLVWFTTLTAAAPNGAHDQGATGHSARQQDTTASSMPPGYAMVRLSDVQRQLTGVVTVAVQRKTLIHTVDLSGVVDEAEPRTFTWSPRFSGWVTKLYVRETGQQVRQGEALMEVYSPPLIQAQQELVYALEQGDSSLIANAGEKLRLLGVHEREIQQLIRERKVRNTLLIRSPFSGVVVKKNVVEGTALRPGMEGFRIVSLDQVWVRAAVPERVAQEVRPGMPVGIRVQGVHGVLEGRVRFVSPVADSRTRTVEIRVNLSNPGGALRPGMVATVRLQQSWPETLVIPGDAVIQTGRRNVVFVEVEKGHYMPREVMLGRYGDQGVEVLKGLREGERVVVRGTFLLDAESRIQGGGGGGGHHH